MNAKVGDRLVVEGLHVGDGRHVDVIIAVRHPDGFPPYEVRWLDSGHETFLVDRHAVAGRRAGQVSIPTAVDRGRRSTPRQSADARFTSIKR